MSRFDAADRLKDYVDVAERIREFREKFPKGGLRAEVIAWPTHDFPHLAVKATAYDGEGREADGHASEPFPGKTPYTRDSELQNAETSAWGRAIIALGAGDAKKVASANEVANRKNDQNPTPPPADQLNIAAPVPKVEVAKATDDQMKTLRGLAKLNHITRETADSSAVRAGIDCHQFSINGIAEINTKTAELLIKQWSNLK